MAGSGQAGPNALQIFHININCTDFERSRRFYEGIGFRLVLDFDAPQAGGRRSFAEIGLGPVLGLPADLEGRACLMQLGDEHRATRLDLIEWKRPVLAARRRSSMAEPGVARICLKVKDCAQLYDHVTAEGHVVYSPPTRIAMGGSPFLVFCCEDPDGVVIEFMQFL